MSKSAPRVAKALKRESRGSGIYRKMLNISYEHEGHYPTSILPFNKEGGGKGRHPTQKPVALFEYLIKTYSNLGEIVLDPFIGSGTTAVAALNTMRKYIGFEKYDNYYKSAIERISEVERNLDDNN